jgi:hypothetical protein
VKGLSKDKRRGSKVNLMDLFKDQLKNKVKSKINLAELA